MPQHELDRTMKLTFVSTIHASKWSEGNAILLAESIRTFGGAVSQYPIRFLCPNPNDEISQRVRERLFSSGATIVPVKADESIPDFPFADDVQAAAYAESLELGISDLMAWLGNDTIVLQEPKAFMLPAGKSLGYRPVHITNIGSQLNSPLDPFWTAIYERLNVPQDRVFPMKAHIEEISIRPYFNAGHLIVRPERRLLQEWRNAFFQIYDDAGLQRLYRQDENYSTFIHQAVLAGVILSSLTRGEMEELPREYNYPIHLYDQDKTRTRPSSLEELVTFRHHEFFEHPEWPNKIPVGEALNNWIRSRLPRT